MRKVRDTHARFKRPADFSIAKHLGDSFGVFSGKAKHRVRIRFDAFAARLINERQWHGSQQVKQLPDGEMELTMVLGGLEEIERWVLSWGTHARVLEPVALTKRIRDIAGELGKIYEK